MIKCYGISVSKGVKIAPALKYVENEIIIPDNAVKDRQGELERFRRSCTKIKDRIIKLQEEAEKSVDSNIAQVFGAHLMFLEDEDSLIGPIEEDILMNGTNAVKAADKQFSDLIAALAEVEDEYIRVRTVDLGDLKSQLLQDLLGIEVHDLSNLREQVIIVARDLAPSDTVRMDLKHVVGIVCEEGSITSHTAIIANAMGLPAIVGCTGLLRSVENGMNLAIDGEAGEILCEPDNESIEIFTRKEEKLRAEREYLKKLWGKPSVSRDGRRVRLSANISKPTDCEAANDNDCEGVGLFRSEFLFMNREDLPGEEEQYKAYREVLEKINNRPVVIRTLDAGGDKKLPALTLTKEDNPFLGYRAIRICLNEKDLFKTQLRALYRASVYGSLSIMLPMISSVSELRKAKEIAAEVREELTREGIAFNPNVPIGIMVEIPAVAVMANVFAKEADFFSIGTNDLTQYTLAVDRGNDKVEPLYSHYHPGVLRLISDTIQAAHAAGIPCGMCGEAAGDINVTEIFLGLGLKSFSMSPYSILAIRERLQSCSYADCQELSKRALAAETAEDVKALLKSGNKFSELDHRNICTN